MTKVNIIEMFKTTFGLCIIVNNDIKYKKNQIITTDSGLKYIIKSIQFPSTPQKNDIVSLICDEM